MDLLGSQARWSCLPRLAVPHRRSHRIHGMDASETWASDPTDHHRHSGCNGNRTSKDRSDQLHKELDPAHNPRTDTLGGEVAVAWSKSLAYEEPYIRNSVSWMNADQSFVWLDAVIDPLETRMWISMGIEAASQSPATKAFNMGVLQT